MTAERRYYVAGGATYRTIHDLEDPDYRTSVRGYFAQASRWVRDPVVVFTVSEAGVTEVDRATALARVTPDELDRA